MAGIKLGSHTLSAPLNVALWIAQCLVAFVFLSSAYLKLTMPIPELSRMMPWTGQTPEAFVRFIGAVDLAGGLGILLPRPTGIFPSLTVAAALGCSVLQVLAAGFHTWRGEAALTPLNYVLLALSLFILWGRYRERSALSA